MDKLQDFIYLAFPLHFVSICHTTCFPVGDSLHAHPFSWTVVWLVTAAGFLSGWMTGRLSSYAATHLWLTVV